jgi:hypothetical protein
MASHEPHNSGLLLSSFGVLKLVDLPLPTASPGSVVVEVLAAYIPSNARGTNVQQITYPIFVSLRCNLLITVA